MSVTLPYYSSLNSQMAEYYKQIKMQEYNDAYHQAQLNIVLDGERNLASQAKIMNRLTQLQQEIANQTAVKIIPLAATNAPEAPVVEEKKFPGMTAAKYEALQAMRKKEKEKAKQKKEREAMQAEDKALQAMRKKKNIKLTSSQVKLTSSQVKLPPIKSKSATNSPLMLSPTSTEETFQQSSMGSPEKKTKKKTLTGKTTKEISSEFANNIKSPMTIENFEIRIEKNKPIYKNLNTGQDIVKPSSDLVQRLYNQYKIQTEEKKAPAKVQGGGLKRKANIARNAKGQFTKTLM